MNYGQGGSVELDQSLSRRFLQPATQDVVLAWCAAPRRDAPCAMQLPVAAIRHRLSCRRACACGRLSYLFTMLQLISYTFASEFYWCALPCVLVLLQSHWLRALLPSASLQAPERCAADGCERGVDAASGQVRVGAGALLDLERRANHHASLVRTSAERVRVRLR